MKKLCCILFGLLLMFVVSTSVFADPLIYKIGPDNEDGYTDYMFGNMVLPIPDYYDFELYDDEMTASFEDSGKAFIKFICYRANKPQIDELKKDIKATHIEMLPDEDKANGIPTVETIKVQGYDATLTTGELHYEIDFIIKNAIIYDTDNNNLVAIYMAYDKQYENTKYPNDFYKMLYSQPSSSSGSSSSYEDDFDYDEYYKFMGDYFNALGTLADGDYTKAAEQFADMYYDMADDKN